MERAGITARQRLKVLKLAQKLGNVAEACRRLGVDRSSFYAWKRRYDGGGLSGLTDQPAAQGVHANAIGKDIVARVGEIALAHPSFGCNRIEQVLKSEGFSVSAVTVQKVLNAGGLGTRQDRCVTLEKWHAFAPGQLTTEQIEFIENEDPPFRDRGLDCRAPGELLHAETILIGSRKGLGKLYLHAVVDGWSHFAFGALALSSDSAIAIDVLSSEALPFFIAANFIVKSVLTGRGREFSGPGWHPYLKVLARYNISRRPIEGADRYSGTIESFRETVLAAFSRGRRVGVADQSLAALQQEFDGWVFRYNHEITHAGFPNHGLTPAQSLAISVDPSD